MSLPPTTLAQPPSRFNQISANDLTFVLGHETQRAFNQIDTAAAYRRFDQAATAISKDNNPINDYTVPIENLIASNRQDEAKAQIAGWNALADRVRQCNPHVDATAMKSLGNGRIDDFVELNPSNPLQAQARQGITFNTDGSLPMTPQNVPPKRLTISTNNREEPQAYPQLRPPASDFMATRITQTTTVQGQSVGPSISRGRTLIRWAALHPRCILICSASASRNRCWNITGLIFPKPARLTLSHTGIRARIHPHVGYSSIRRVCTNMSARRLILLLQATKEAAAVNIRPSTVPCLKKYAKASVS